MPRNSDPTFCWKLHTPAFLKEIVKCSQVGIYYRPIQLMARMLHEVGERASELNDPLLNDLMCKLTLYEIADPWSPQYDVRRVNAIARKATKIKYVKRKKSMDRTGDLERVQGRPRGREASSGGVARGKGRKDG